MNRSIGQAGEKAAADYLKEKGYIIIQKNYRSPWGEIDLIARHQGSICFIEVKSREQRYFGHPLDAVDDRKRKRIIRAAKAYLAEHYPFQEPACRFDVVSIEEDRQINVIEDAFQT